MTVDLDEDVCPDCDGWLLIHKAGCPRRPKADEDEIPEDRTVTARVDSEDDDEGVD